MTRRIGKLVVIAPEAPQQCDQCGKIEELRPYGPGFSMVCFDCAMLDKEGTDRRMAHRLFGDPIDASDNPEAP